MIKERDGSDPLYADELRTLHDATFLDSAPMPNFETGHCWLVYDRDLWAYGVKSIVAFATIVPSYFDPLTIGYFNRVGVLPRARGHKLQRRLLSVIERRARKNGWTTIISDTTDNPPSANAMISAGYKIFEPAVRWSFQHSIYWKKELQ